MTPRNSKEARRRINGEGPQNSTQTTKPREFSATTNGHIFQERSQPSALPQGAGDHEADNWIHIADAFAPTFARLTGITKEAR